MTFLYKLTGFLLIVFSLANTAYSASPLQLPQPIALDQKSIEILALKSDSGSEKLANPSVLFFGYTKCNDICPMTLNNTAQVIKSLEGQGVKLSGIFVTIDPERDSEAQLAQYFKVFNDRFRIIRANKENMNHLAEVFGIETIDYNRYEGNENYVIDHSGTSFVIDNDQRIVSMMDLSGHKVDISGTAKHIIDSLKRTVP